MAYKGIAWCYSTKIRAGNFMCTVIEINIDILQLADSSNTGAGTSQADLSSAPAHGNKKPARQKIFPQVCHNLSRFSFLKFVHRLCIDNLHAGILE